MNLNLDNYRSVNKDFFKVWLDRFPDKNPIDFIGEMSASTFVPIICVAYYVGELKGFTPELQAFIKRLMEFYHIDSISGQL